MTTITTHNAYATAGHIVLCGLLTTEHSASSYNLPVFVVGDGTFVGKENWGGRVICPSECDNVSLGLHPELFGEDTSRFEDRITAAGYTLRS